MLTNYNNAGTARNVTYHDDIDAQIATEIEQKHLREGRPSIYSCNVSQAARDAWQARLWRNQESVRSYQVRDQAVVASDREGKTLSMVKFLKLLNTLPNRKFQLNDWAVRGMRGLSVAKGCGPMTYVCAVQDVNCPEWDKVTLDDHGLVKRVVRRGYRTVCVMLWDAKAITEKEIYALFGHGYGAHGEVFRRTMWEGRNRKLWDGCENSEYWRLRKVEEFDRD